MEPIPLSAATWWYVAVLAAGAGGAVAGVAIAAVSGRGVHPAGWLRSPALVVAAVCATGLLVALVSAWDRWGGTFVSIDGRELRVQVEFFAKLGSAATLGVFVPTLAGLGGWWLRRRRAPVVAYVLPAVVVAAAMGSALLIAKYSVREREVGDDPFGTVVEDPQAAAEQLASDLVLPTGLAVAPTGDIYYTQLVSDELRVLSPDGTSSVVATLPVKPGEQVFDLVLHPGWPEIPYVYVTVERVEGEERGVDTIRLNLADPDAGVTTLIEGMPIGGDHPASALAICGEYLFTTTGDTDFAAHPREDSPRWQAQNPLSRVGKVMRYRLAGIDLEPAGVIAQEPPVYAMGFRNLFGLTCDPATGYPLGVENGFDGRDQVRLIPPGTNHEWPLSDTRERMTPPLYDSGLRPLGPTGVVARPAAGGTEILFTTWHSDALYQLLVDAEGNVGPLTRLFKAPTGVLAVALDPGGCAVIADAESIWRVAIEGCVAP